MLVQKIEPMSLTSIWHGIETWRVVYGVALACSAFRLDNLSAEHSLTRTCARKYFLSKADNVITLRLRGYLSLLSGLFGSCKHLWFSGSRHVRFPRLLRVESALQLGFNLGKPGRIANEGKSTCIISRAFAIIMIVSARCVFGQMTLSRRDYGTSPIVVRGVEGPKVSQS